MFIIFYLFLQLYNKKYFIIFNYFDNFKLNLDNKTNYYNLEKKKIYYLYIYLVYNLFFKFDNILNIEKFVIMFLNSLWI